MNKDNCINKNRYIYLAQMSAIILAFTFVILPAAVFSQFGEYKIKGRVVNNDGESTARVDVRISPTGYVLETPPDVDQDGNFSIVQQHDKGETYYLFVSDYSYSKNKSTLLDPPFFYYSRKNFNFLGKPVKFGDQKIIDLGNVGIQFWFADLNVEIKSKGMDLTVEQWQQLWCRLKDDQGRIAVQESFGLNTINQFVMDNSQMKLSLPEGKWQLEFHKFDLDKGQIDRQIMARTPYFIINKNKHPETIKISLLR